MDPTVSNDTRKPELCSECLDAGCDSHGANECVRDDAYGAAEPAEPIPVTVESAILAITGGRDGSQVRLTVHHDTDGTATWYATQYQWSHMGVGYSEQRQGKGPSLRLAVHDLAGKVRT